MDTIQTIDQKLKTLTTLKEKIEYLRIIGIKRKEILIKLNIDLNQYSYQINKDKQLDKKQKYQENFREKSRQKPYYCLISKVNKFKIKNKNFPKIDYDYTDVLLKFNNQFFCYLTGEPIDIAVGTSYHLDHIIPSSKGGSNELDNLQLCSKYANLAKNDLTIDELKVLCQKILNYSVTH